MKFIKTFINRIIAILLLLCVFCACTPNDDTEIIPPQNQTNQTTNETKKATAGGTLNIPINKNLYTLHPLYIKEAQTLNVFSILFETLFVFDQNLEPSAYLAQSWKFSETENALIIEIRPNVHWHNDLGEISALDAAWTINKILSDQSANHHLALSAYVLSAEGSGNTLTIKTKNNSYALLYELCSIPIIPEAYYSQKPAVTFDIPIGSGCYLVSSYTAEKMDMIINQKWWKKLPYIENICAKAYVDTDQIINAFLNKEIDCFPSSRITTEVYEILDGVSSFEYLSHNYLFLGLNYQKAHLNNSVFRQAIAYSLDRTEIINNIYLSKASGAEQPLFNDYSISSTNIPRHDTNKTKAKELFSSLGYSDTNNNGILDKNGKDLSFNIYVLNDVNDPVRRETANNIKKQLEEVGILLNVNAVSQQDIINVIQNKSFDMIISGYHLSNAPDFNFLFSSAGNITNYSSQNMKNNINSYFSASSLSMLKQACYDIQLTFSQELPHIGLLFQMETFIYYDSLSPSQIKRDKRVYENINEWFINK